MKRHLAFVLLGAALVTGPVLAQSNQASTAGTSGSFLSQEKPGQWRASKLKGLNVYNANNEKIGDINELLVDSSGRVDAVVIGAGGFLGMGEHDVAVPFNEIKFVNEPRAAAGTAANRATPADPNAPVTTGSTTVRNSAEARSYPDHAMLNMTKDQLKAAPAFQYAR